MPKYVNEATAMNVHARFFDTHNAPTTPTSVRYLIRDLTNDREVRAWTDISPFPELDIEVTAEDNTLLNTKSKKRFEERVLTVQANVGLDTQFTEELSYFVRNLRGLNS